MEEKSIEIQLCVKVTKAIYVELSEKSFVASWGGKNIQDKV